MSNSISNVYNFYKQVQEKINSYTPPLSEDAIVRCLYLELGKKVGLNYSYYRSDAIKRWTLEHDGYSEVEGERERIVEKVMEDDAWIAIESEIAIAQEVVGKYLGVDIKVIKDESEKSKPRFLNLVTRRDGSQYRVNLAQDLINIQTNCITTNFGLDENGNPVFTKEQIRSMDLLLGYISDERPYAEENLDKLRAQVAEIESFPDKMNYLLSHISLSPNEHIVGYNGIRAHHTSIIEKVIGNSSDWEFVDCYSYDRHANKVYKPIIMVRDGEQEHYYIYSEDQRSYMEDKAAIEEELRNGLIVPNMYVNYKGLYNIAVEISKGHSSIYGYDPSDNYH